MRDALRLCLGTLTVLPVRPPTRVDRRVAGLAMGLAPLAAAVLAVVAGPVLWLLAQVLSPVLAAALTVGLLALLTRGMHLDGLADTADGLGSGAPAGRALDIMRRGDVGPFGVVTLVLVLLVQVAALGSLGPARSAVAVAVALVVSRAVLPLLCVSGVPAARPDGLGHLVAGTVSATAAALSVLLAAVLVTCALLLGTSGGTSYGVVQPVVAAVLAPVAGAAYARHCMRRFGGVTGDVLGAGVEVTFTAALVMLAFR